MNPLAIAMLALSVGQEVARFGATKQANRAGRKAANDDHRLTMADIRARMAEESRATGLQIDRAGLQVDAAQGAAQASAAGAGLGGKSIDLLLDSIKKEGIDFNLSAEENLATTQAQLERAGEAAGVERDNRIAQLPTYNPLLGGLRLGSSALDLAASRQRTRPPGAPNG